MGSNSYKNVSNVSDYGFADPNGQFGKMTGEAGNMANYGKAGMTSNMDASGNLVNQAVTRAGAPQAWMQEFTSQVAPGIYQAFGDMNNRTGYAGSLFDLAANVGQNSQRQAAQGFAGGALNSGAAQFARQKAIADAQLQAQNTASGMLTQTLGAGLQQGMGLSQQNYGQGTNQMLQGAGQFGQNAAQFGQLYGQGNQIGAQLAQHGSGMVQPTYVKDKNWFDYGVEGLNAAGSAASGVARLMNPMSAAAGGVMDFARGVGGAIQGAGQGIQSMFTPKPQSWNAYGGDELMGGGGVPEGMGMGGGGFLPQSRMFSAPGQAYPSNQMMGRQAAQFPSYMFGMGGPQQMSDPWTMY